MKKLISLLLLLALLLSVVSCTVDKPDEQEEHVHEFILSETDSIAATCTDAGLEVKVCSCGEKQEKAIEAIGHDMRVTMDVQPTCTATGSIDYMCYNCGKRQYTNVDALGHNYPDAPTEPSRVIVCSNENCTSCIWGEPNNKNKEALTFNFTKDDEAALDAKYDEVLAIVNAAAKYDASLHKYAESGALADEYAVFDTAMTELYDLVLNVISQRTLAEVAYYCDMKSEELEETYSYMKDYQTAIVAKYYTLSRPIYDSCYREFYYLDMTEEEINAYLFDSDAISNPEYTALKDRNNAIETEFLALSSTSGDLIPTLYAEFAENNNKMAQLMGYDNYLEYAYENVYGRGYTHEDVKAFSDYVKIYISPVFTKVYNKWSNLAGYTEDDLTAYKKQMSHPFFQTLDSNTLVNDFIDLFEFTSNPDKKISFSDEFNKLMGDGNMFRGDYEGAFVTSIYSAKLPVAYFGKGYDSAFTIVHEFGHYMNEVYSAGIFDNEDFSQSYDILEMHSQGNELLYLCFLEENAELSEVAHTLVETHALVNMLYSSIAGMTVDAFEQAVYLNKYEGPSADVIMADGKITSDEYDLLYSSICSEYGAEEALKDYWRYGMTITSPAYYVSYSVSALSVLQLYEIAHSEGFDVAQEAYLKLFTYVDENPEMTVEEILDYAGLLSYSNEELYSSLHDYFIKK